MDMAKLLQKLDSVAANPAVDANSMRKFLRVVREAEINQPAAPATAAPTTPQVDPAKYQVPSIDFFKKNYKHPADIIDGAHPSTSDPTRIGAWKGGSDFADLMMALSGSYYQARQADPNFKQPAFVKDDWELIQRMLGTPEGKEYAIDQSIGLSNIDDKSPDAEFNRAQHKEFEKQANARFMQQPDGIFTPGWKYDQKLGMTPAQAELQKQKAQQTVPVQENNLNKFLSIVNKNNVGILKEGKSPHKVTLPVQMAMQHYQTPQEETPHVFEPIERENILGKYFHQVESEIAEQHVQKRNLINQYATVIAERVMMKEAANPAQQAAIAIAKKKKKSVAENEIPGHSMGFKPGAGAPGIMPNEGMSAQVKLSRAWDREQAKSTASAERARQAKAEFEKEWKEKQEKQSQEKNPIKEANKLARLTKEEMLHPVKSTRPKTIKPRTKTSVCRTGQTQTGMQTKNGMTVPKCSVK